VQALKQDSKYEYRRFIWRTAQSYLYRGITKNHLTHHEAAIADFLKSLKLDPADALAVYRLGMAYFEAEEYELVLKLMLLSYDFRPDQPFALYYTGASYYHTGDIIKAIEFLKDYELMVGDDNSSNYYLGLCYYDLKSYSEAAKCFSKCEEDGPFFEEAEGYLEKGERKI